MNPMRLLCLMGQHKLKKQFRLYPPAIGREEMRCVRKGCKKYYLIPLEAKEGPRFSKVYNIE